MSLRAAQEQKLTHHRKDQPAEDQGLFADCQLTISNESDVKPGKEKGPRNDIPEALLKSGIKRIALPEITVKAFGQ